MPANGHTPGPWTIREVRPGRANTPMLQIAQSTAPGNWAIAQIVRGNRVLSERKANARLIAQAPAMLAVLRELVAEWSEGGLFGDRAADPASVQEARAILRAVEG